MLIGSAAEPTWRRLVMHKRERIIDCETLWLPEIVTERTRTFLEIGGGMCYASALAKLRNPSMRVVATDWSVTCHAPAAGAFLEAPADVYMEADALSLPFADGAFEAVFSRMVLYQTAAPVQALREINRVLAPGGSYLGIESAAPWNVAAFNAEAERRAAYGDAGALVTLVEWREIAQSASAGAAVELYPGRRIASRSLRFMMNLFRPLHVAIRITKPC